MVRDFMMKLVTKWLSDTLTVDVLRDWAAKARELYIELTDDIIARLRAEAKKTDTRIDDVVVDKFVIFRDQLIPQCEVKID